MTDLMPLLKTCSSLFTQEEKANLVVFGSAAVCLRNIPFRETDDLDFISDEALFEKMKRRFVFQVKKSGNGLPYEVLMPLDKVEILKHYPGVLYPQVKRNAEQLSCSEDFLVASLTDVVKWKEAQGREKDKKDLEALAPYLSL